MVNAEVSDENAAVISTFLEDISSTFGDAVYCMPRKSLHITLLDWIAPLFDYDGRDKAELYDQVYESYDRAMSNVMADQEQFTVRFNELRVFPNTIVMLGKDDGQFAAMRQQFVEKVDLIPGTKAAPSIIHSSLARFRQELDLEQVEQAVARHSIDFTQTIDNFRLVHSTQEPLAKFEVIKRHVLGKID